MKRALLIISILAFTQCLAITDTVTIRSNPSNSRFRYINNAPSDTGSCFGGNSMVIARWTTGGIPFTWRTLLKFDLPTLPAGATIDTAYLSVYANTSSPSGNPGSPTWGTNNAVGIYRLTSSWDTTTLTWGTQPTYVTANADTLAQSSSWTQNYLNVDITALVKDAYLYGNHGFLFKHLQEVSTLNSMIFLSPYSHTIDSNKTPQLKIKYTYTTAVAGPAKEKMNFDLYPNPANDFVSVNITGGNRGVASVFITDCTGREYATTNIFINDGKATSSIDISRYPKGVYLVRAEDANGVIAIRKLVVN